MPGPPPNRPRYAARLNAFRAGLTGDARQDTARLIARAASVDGLDAADLNFPDQVNEADAARIGAALADHGLALNGLAMRYYGDPALAAGALTNPDPARRQRAIDLTRAGLDCAAAMGAPLMTLWLGQDGFDYAFQLDYARAWDDTIDGLRRIADHAPDIDIAIEYKPNEPRAFALIPDAATAILAVREADRPNLGVTIDMAHALYADEMPAHSAHLVHRHSRLLGVHLNDGNAKRDDGLMAGTVHPVATVELLAALLRIGYEGVLYFDTFPDHSGLDPVEETRTNIRLTERLRAVAAELAADPDLDAAIAAQDAAQSQRIVARALYGA